MESIKEREEWEICCLHAACIPVEEHVTEEEMKGQFVATSSIALEFLLFERWFSSALTHRFTLVFSYKSS